MPSAIQSTLKGASAFIGLYFVLVLFKALPLALSICSDREGFSTFLVRLFFLPAHLFALVLKQGIFRAYAPDP